MSVNVTSGWYRPAKIFYFHECKSFLSFESDVIFITGTIYQMYDLPDIQTLVTKYYSHIWLVKKKKKK